MRLNRFLLLDNEVVAERDYLEAVIRNDSDAEREALYLTKL